MGTRLGLIHIAIRPANPEHMLSWIMHRLNFPGSSNVFMDIIKEMMHNARSIYMIVIMQ